MYEQASPSAYPAQSEVTEVHALEDADLDSVVGGNSRTTVPSHVPDIIMVDQTTEE